MNPPSTVTFDGLNPQCSTCDGQGCQGSKFNTDAMSEAGEALIKSCLLAKTCDSESKAALRYRNCPLDI